MSRLHSTKRFFFTDDTFIDHVDGYFNGSSSGALACAGLQEIEFALFDCKLNILHVAIMLFKHGDIGLQFIEDRLHLTFHLGYLSGCTHAGDNIFPLSVDQILAIEHFLAGAGIAGEANPGAGIIVEVAEDHRLHINCRAKIVVDFIEVAIIDSPAIVPRTKDRFDSAGELFTSILRERFAGALLNQLFVLLYQLFQVGHRKV